MESRQTENPVNHWILNNIAEKRQNALIGATCVRICRAQGLEELSVDVQLMQDVVFALELAVIDFLSDKKTHPDACSAARDAFRILRVLPLPEGPIPTARHLLRASTLAVIGDFAIDAKRWLQELADNGAWPELPLDSEDWMERAHATMFDAWLHFFREDDTDDFDQVLARLTALREAQPKLEAIYLKNIPADEAKSRALELIALYHLIKAYEILMNSKSDGLITSNEDMHFALKTHFLHAMRACDSAGLVELSNTTSFLVASTVNRTNLNLGFNHARIKKEATLEN